MILYLDTSAIVKKYFKEQGSIEVIRLWKKTSSIVTSTVAYAETLAAIHLPPISFTIAERGANNLPPHHRMNGSRIR